MGDSTERHLPGDEIAEELLGPCPTAAALLDGTGRVVCCNAAAELLLGRAASDVAGQSLGQFLAMPEQLSATLERWRELSAEERRHVLGEVRLHARGPDGSDTGVALTLADRSGGGAVAWLRPVAEMSTYQPAPDVFRIIFERAPEGISILDADLRQRSANPASLELIGALPGLEDVGHGRLYVHPDDQAILDERVRRRAAGEPVPEGPIRYRVAHADGTWRWLESLSMDLRDVPSINGFVVLSRDVTEDEEHRIALEAATERLAQLDRSRNLLLSSVSHELRTPLAAILSASEHLAADPVDADELHAYAGLIRRNAARLDALVGDLLLIGRLQNGTLPVELGPVDVTAVVRQVSAAHDRPDGPPIDLDLEPGPPARADAGRLVQVVENLLTNGLKFGGAAGVRISVRADDDRWTISVMDHGPGIAPDVLDRVFAPFFRAPATEHSAGGTGLGLTITRGVVELHDGTIDLGPADGGGTEVVVTLPIWSGHEEGSGGERTT